LPDFLLFKATPSGQKRGRSAFSYLPLTVL
jgi:hypothetical protein